MAPLSLQLENGTFASADLAVCIFVAAGTVVVIQTVVGRIVRPVIWAAVLLAAWQGVVARPVVPR
jgi:hypothetical protein